MTLQGLHPAPPPVFCRVCGAPGRLYLSGRWCPVHLPHPVNPAPPARVDTR